MKQEIDTLCSYIIESRNFIIHNIQDTIPNYQTYEKTGKCDPYLKEKAIKGTNSEMTQVLELAYKEFKGATITITGYVKEHILNK